jgi:hypothetical protein
MSELRCGISKDNPDPVGRFQYIYDRVIEASMAKALLDNKAAGSSNEAGHAPHSGEHISDDVKCQSSIALHLEGASMMTLAGRSFSVQGEEIPKLPFRSLMVEFWAGKL